MNRVDNMPTTYEDCARILGTRDERVIANNTRVRRTRTPDRADRYSVVLHTTDIVTFYVPVEVPADDSGTAAGETVRMVRLHSGGHRSVTTKRRMNACLDGSPYRVTQRAYAWYVVDTARGFLARDYSDGMLLDVS